jgi:hypothetical protein
MDALPIPTKVDYRRDPVTFRGLSKLTVLLWVATIYQARTLLYSNAMEFSLTSATNPASHHFYSNRTRYLSMVSCHGIRRH